MSRLSIVAFVAATGCSRQLQVPEPTYRETVTAFHTALAAMQTSQEVLARREFEKVTTLVPAQRIDTSFDLGVFQAGRIELVQDFARFDHNGDGRVDDGDLLFAVTLRSAFPERNLLLDDCDNTFFAFYAQDDWRVTPELTLNLGLRWEMDTDAKQGSPDVAGEARRTPSAARVVHAGQGGQLRERRPDPFSSGPLDPNDLEREKGPSPNDRRHRFTLAGSLELPAGFRVAPLVTLSTGVPMDILMPDASTRVPALSRNAGGRRFHTGAELNAFLRGLNAGGGVNGVLLPLVRDDARFSDSFSSFDLRASRVFGLGGGRTLEAIAEVFNLFDTENILGGSVRNYSGFSNVLVRDADDPDSPGYLTSSAFGQPVSTAGGVFGSGGPRALQLGMRLGF